MSKEKGRPVPEIAAVKPVLLTLADGLGRGPEQGQGLGVTYTIRLIGMLNTVRLLAC